MKNYFFKLFLITMGSIISAYGITLAIHAGFGCATLAVLWQGVSKTFHISLGTASFIIALIMIIVVFFYDRKQIFVGTGIYSSVDMGRGSYEAVTFAINSHTGWLIRYIRMVIDAIVVVVGMVLGGKFGICTIVTIFISGPMIQQTVKVMKNLVCLKTK